jgi:hypothetical protein
MAAPLLSRCVSLQTATVLAGDAEHRYLCHESMDLTNQCGNRAGNLVSHQVGRQPVDEQLQARTAACYAVRSVVFGFVTLLALGSLPTATEEKVEVRSIARLPVVIRWRRRNEVSEN